MFLSRLSEIKNFGRRHDANAGEILEAFYIKTYGSDCVSDTPCCSFLFGLGIFILYDVVLTAAVINVFNAMIGWEMSFKWFMLCMIETVIV